MELPKAPKIPLYDPSKASESIKDAISLIPVDRALTRVLANSENFFKPLMTLISSCWAQTRTIRSSEWQVALLRTAAWLDCTYEQQVNEPLAKFFGFDDKAVQCLRLGDLSDRDRFSNRHRLISRMVEELMQHKRLLPETVAKSNDLFTPEGTMEILTIHGTYSMIAHIMRSAEIDVDPPIPNLEATLRKFNQPAIDKEEQQRYNDKIQSKQHSSQSGNPGQVLQEPEQKKRPYRAKAAAQMVNGMSHEIGDPTIREAPATNTARPALTNGAISTNTTVTALAYDPCSKDRLCGLQLYSYQLPPPVAEEVTVRWLYAPVNPQDILVVQGRYPTPPSHRTPSGHLIPGYDGVGQVIGVQAGATTDLKQGDIVIPSPTKQGIGSWRTYATVPATELMALPESSKPTPALSMLQMSYLVAYTLLQGRDLYPNDWVVLNAGASTTAQATAMLAKKQGFHTALVVRDYAPEALRSMSKSLEKAGADVILTESQMAIPGVPQALQGKRVVLALDAVFGASASNLLKVLSPGSTFVNYGTLEGAGPNTEMPVASEALFWKGIKLESYRRSEAVKKAGEDKVRDLLLMLATWINRGELGQVEVDVLEWEEKAVMQAVQRKWDEPRGSKVVFAFSQS